MGISALKSVIKLCRLSLLLSADGEIKRSYGSCRHRIERARIRRGKALTIRELLCPPEAWVDKTDDRNGPSRRHRTGVDAKRSTLICFVVSAPKLLMRLALPALVAEDSEGN